jgi:hypothetical protein
VGTRHRTPASLARQPPIGAERIGALLKDVSERPMTEESKHWLDVWALAFLTSVGRPEVIAELQARLPEGQPLRSPEHVLMERIVLAMQLTTWGLGLPAGLDVTVRNGGGDRRAAALATALMLTESVPYLWSNDTRRAVTEMAEKAGSPLPSHVLTRDAVPAPVMWWTWETEWSDAEDRTLQQQGMLFHPIPVPPGRDGIPRMGLAVTELGTKGARLVVRTGLLALFGECYPEDLAGRPMYEMFMRFLAFLNSPYIPKAEEAVSRQARRWTERLDAPDLLRGGVRFLVLRRQAKERADGGGEGMQYSHRWLVSGHFRNQFYPSEDTHKVIWIAPYVKGPDGAPLKEKVFRVSR